MTNKEIAISNGKYHINYDNALDVPELSGYYNYWYGDKRGCSDGIYATECGKERRRFPN